MAPASPLRRTFGFVRRSLRRGFTLLEVLIALTITLILMGLVMEIFANVGEAVTNSRAVMDLSDQLRHAKHRLIGDLRGVTAPTVPPLSPHMNLGYFEYVEGPRVATSQFAENSSGGDVGENLYGGNWYRSRNTRNNNQTVNSIIGDVDDILMFTTASIDQRFTGRAGMKSGMPQMAKSRYAEVAWFLRRRTQAEARSVRGDSRPEYYTLHRRQFLVLPNGLIHGATTHANLDHSLRAEGGSFETTALPINRTTMKRVINPNGVRNSLGDLTMRERRSLHQPFHWPYQMLYVAPQFNFPSNVDYHSLYLPTDGETIGWNTPTSALSLPTLAEQTHANFPLPHPEVVKSSAIVLKSSLTPTPPPGYVIMGNAGTHSRLLPGSRMGDDVILTNVVSFDVKAWDPGAPVFRAVSSTGNPNNAGVLIPGDAGYARAVDVFNSAPTSAGNQPVAFGAFADLNYMGRASAPPNHDLRYRNYMDKGNSSALNRMEAGAPFRGLSKLPRAQFAYPGDGPLSGKPTHGSFARPAVWDTWSTHYEHDGVDNDGDGVIDELTNGVDDNGNGLVDEPNIYNNTGEQDAPPPYRSPLRGLKITIRVCEQDSKEVREVTLVHEFVPFN